MDMKSFPWRSEIEGYAPESLAWHKTSLFLVAMIILLGALFKTFSTSH